LALQPGQRVLDVATGTGALALEIARAGGGSIHITGCDLNERMLSVARQRLANAPTPVELHRCDAANLPFPASSFDAVTLAFAIDDMPDRDACIAEITRVLRPGGRLVLLELSQPDTQPFKGAYDLYLDAFRWLKRVRIDGYDHLAQEIRGYRGAQAIAELLERHRFGDYAQRALTAGIARLHVARLQPAHEEHPRSEKTHG
jgi:demethylmenaquinone methyltransferase/2-methoxy-6-polyprenyl-1,4-benzoquinol methylase